jgi:hypothetical protein
MFGLVVAAGGHGVEFHDVTIGDYIVYGGGFYASPGSDLPTGLGSPDGAHTLTWNLIPNKYPPPPDSPR